MNARGANECAADTSTAPKHLSMYRIKGKANRYCLKPNLAGTGTAPKPF